MGLGSILATSKLFSREPGVIDCQRSLEKRAEEKVIITLTMLLHEPIKPTKSPSSKEKSGALANGIVIMQNYRIDSDILHLA